MANAVAVWGINPSDQIPGRDHRADRQSRGDRLKGAAQSARVRNDH